MRVESRTRTEGYTQLAAFFDDFAATEPRWQRRNRTYHALLSRITQFHVLPHASVLEIGCGSGDLLASLRPSRGVGVDVSSRMIESARSAHPELELLVGAGEDLDLDETFDYIILSDLVPYAYDLVALFEAVARHSHP